MATDAFGKKAASPKRPPPAKTQKIKKDEPLNLTKTHTVKAKNEAKNWLFTGAFRLPFYAKLESKWELAHLESPVAMFSISYVLHPEKEFAFFLSSDLAWSRTVQRISSSRASTSITDQTLLLGGSGGILWRMRPSWSIAGQLGPAFRVIANKQLSSPGYSSQLEPSGSSIGLLLGARLGYQITDHWELTLGGFGIDGSEHLMFGASYAL